MDNINNISEDFNDTRQLLVLTTVPMTTKTIMTKPSSRDKLVGKRIAIIGGTSGYKSADAQP